MSRNNFRHHRRYYRHCREDWRRDHYRNHRRNGSFFGIMVAVIGILLLLKTLNILFFSFAVMWPVVLIAMGLFIGLRTSFRHPGSWILIIIGAANLTPQFMLFGHPSSELVWPAALIVFGLAIALRPRRRMRPFVTPGTIGDNMDTFTSSENTIDLDVTFGGRKEFVTSKNFKGGVVSATFGGCEVNLMQADTTEQTMELTIKVSFGGVELIVPPHWEIRNEMQNSFSSVEDERTIQTTVPAEERKTLVLKGGCSFGSVEIKSY